MLFIFCFWNHFFLFLLGDLRCLLMLLQNEVSEKSHPHTHLSIHPPTLHRCSDRDKTIPVTLALVRRPSLILSSGPFPPYEPCCAACEIPYTPHSSPFTFCVPAGMLWKSLSACLQEVDTREDWFLTQGRWKRSVCRLVSPVLGSGKASILLVWIMHSTSEHLRTADSMFVNMPTHWNLSVALRPILEVHFQSFTDMYTLRKSASPMDRWKFSPSI